MLPPREEHFDMLLALQKEFKGAVGFTLLNYGAPPRHRCFITEPTEPHQLSSLKIPSQNNCTKPSRPSSTSSTPARSHRSSPSPATRPAATSPCRSLPSCSTPTRPFPRHPSNHCAWAACCCSRRGWSSVPTRRHTRATRRATRCRSARTASSSPA